MKQTAVEWFLTEFQKQVWFEPNSELDIWVKALIPKAKEMEREQIENAFGKKCYHPLTERKYTSDVHFECTICGDNNY